MKRSVIIGLCLLVYIFAFSQKAKGPTKKEKAKMDSAAKATTANPNVPQNTVIFILTQDQVRLLEYVISESNAGFKQTNQLIEILKTQQYHAPVQPKDSIPPVTPPPGHDPGIPSNPKDSTASKN